MGEPQRLSVGNSVEVAKIDERGTPAHEGGQAYICQLNHQNSGNVLVEFILGGRLSAPPAKILRKVTLDTLGKRWACDKVSRPSLMSIHHASSKQRQQSGAANATEERSASTTTCPVYKKLLDSSTWDAKKGRIDRHPMLSFLKQGGKQKEVGWLRKEEAAEAQNNCHRTLLVGRLHSQTNLGELPKAKNIDEGPPNFLLAVVALTPPSRHPCGEYSL
jgi:hypothetical protein